MGDKNWKSAIALILGALTGFFWLFFGITKFIFFAWAWEELIKGMLIGGIVMISTAIAMKHKLLGGIFMMLEGLGAFSYMFFNQSYEAMLFAFALGVPLFLAGVFILVAKFTSRS